MFSILKKYQHVRTKLQRFRGIPFTCAFLTNRQAPKTRKRANRHDFTTKHSLYDKKISKKRYAWLPSLATLLILPILLSLGFWQIQRAQQKQTLIQHYKERKQHPPLSLQQIESEKKIVNLRYYRAQLTGHYDNTHQIFVDNRLHNHRVGYYILTPFVLSANRPLIGSAIK